MRDRIALVLVATLLGLAVGVWAWLLAPCEWHSALYKNAYWPFTVEIAVRDR